MSHIPPLVSLESIEKQLWIITARVKVLTQYAATSIADRDIYILLEDVYDGLQSLNLNDIGATHDRFASLKADFMVLSYYEGDASDRDFGNSMYSLSEKFEAASVALDNRLEFESIVSKLQKVGASHE